MDRVRVAVLKISGESVASVCHWIAVAKCDYRDVLAATVYPKQLVSKTWEMSEPERRAIEAEDLRA